MEIIKKIVEKFSNIRKINLFIFVVIIFIYTWFFYIIPSIVKIPDNFTYQMDLVSIDNFYNVDKGEYTGEEYSKSINTYNVLSKDVKYLNLRTFFKVQTLDNKKIFEFEQEVSVDPYTGILKNKNEQGKDVYLFGPRFLNKDKEFTFKHFSSDRSVDMQFIGEEYIYGLKTYKYTSEDTIIDQTSSLSFLPGVSDEKGIKLEPKVTLWIEPVTGWIVNLEDGSKDYYYYDIKSGEKLYPYNIFLNKFSENFIYENVKSAENLKILFIIIYFIIPIISILCLLYLIFLKFNHTSSQKVSRFLRGNIIEILILTSSVLIAIFVFLSINQYYKNETSKYYDMEGQKVEEMITERFSKYLQALYGVRSLFYSSKEVTRDEFKAYTDHLGIFEKLSGIQGIGFAKVAYGVDEKNKLIERIHKEGFENFSITPQDERDFYTSIIYLEPFNDRNQRAFGFDMFSEEVRRKAMESSIRSNETVASGKVMLLQEYNNDAQDGFLVYLPLFKKGFDPVGATYEERLTNLEGFVYAPFRINDLLDNILKNQKISIYFNIYDGLKNISENKIFSFLNPNSNKIVYNKKTTYYIAGHPWSFEFFGEKKSGLLSTYFLDIYFSLSIIIVGIFLTIVFSSVSRSKSKAQSAVKKVTAEFEKNIDELKRTKTATLNILEDIAEEKEKLKYLTNRFELAVESANIGVWEWYISENKIIWDNKMFELYEKNQKEFDVTYDSWFSIIHPEDTASIKKELEVIFSGNKDSFNFSFRVVLSENKIRYMNIYAHVIKDKQNKANKIFGVNLDITHEKEVDRAKTEFVSLASHQLKTPVGALKWNMEMLLDGDYGKLTQEQRGVIEDVYAMTNRMNKLISDFLNISRIDMGTFVIEPKEVSYAEYCENVLKELNQKIVLKKQTIIKNFQKDLPLLMADPGLLNIIFQNLISNAVKYTQELGEIEITINSNSKKVFISVRNNGELIPEKDQKYIFDKMFRTEQAQKMDPDGNGLGLYLLKSIVESAGGKIWFVSNKSGTTFFVEFPYPGMKEKKGSRKIS